MNIMSIKKYLPFAKGSWMMLLAYRMHVYLWVLSDAMSVVLMCLLWAAVYRMQNGGLENAIIHGFTFIEMIQYTLLSRIASQLVGFTESFWTMSEDIREGKIAMTLMKPISYRLKNLFASIGGFFASFVMIGIPMLTIFFGVLYYLHLPLPSIIQVGVFILTLLFGLIIMDTMDFLFALSSIFTGALFGLGQIKNIIYAFFSGAILPLTFFPGSIKKIIDLLPYSSMVSAPVQIILGKVDISSYPMILGMQFFWIVVLNLLAKVLFDRFIKHVVVVGG